MSCHATVRKVGFYRFYCNRWDQCLPCSQEYLVLCFLYIRPAPNLPVELCSSVGRIGHFLGNMWMFQYSPQILTLACFSINPLLWWKRNASDLPCKAAASSSEGINCSAIISCVRRVFSPWNAAFDRQQDSCLQVLLCIMWENIRTFASNLDTF